MRPFHPTQYYCYNAAPIFFVYFLGIGLFFILNLVLAVSYSTFQDSTKSKVLHQVRNRVRCMDLAFDTLAKEEGIPLPHEVVAAETHTRMAPLGCAGVPVGLPRETLYRLIRRMRKSRQRSPLGALEMCTIFNVLNDSKTGLVSQREFRELPSYVEMTLQEKAGPGSADLYGEAAHSTPCLLRARLSTRKVVKTRLFSWFFDLLVAMTGVAVVVSLHYPEDSDTYHSISTLTTTMLWAFVLEIAVKIFGGGSKAFWSDGFNKLDAFVVGGGATTYIVVQLLPGTANTASVSDIFTFLRLLRLLRILRNIPTFRVIVRTFTYIMPFFARYLVVVGCVFYVFAIFGMELFAGKVVASNSVVVNSSFGQDQYWNNTFNSLYESFITLFELTMCVAAATRGPR